MENCGTQLLETDRLLLRRFTLDDAEAMYQNWASDPEVTKYLMWPSHKSISISLDVLKEWVSSYEQQNTYQWAIIIKNESPEPIGTIGVVNQNEAIAMAHIGYCIGRKWWHQGITSEALKAVIDFLFYNVGINRSDLSVMHFSLVIAEHYGAFYRFSRKSLTSALRGHTAHKTRHWR